MDGKAERRWLGTSPCDNERTIALRKNALRAYKGKSSELIPPGPRARVDALRSTPTRSVWSICWDNQSVYCCRVKYRRWLRSRRMFNTVWRPHRVLCSFPAANLLWSIAVLLPRCAVVCSNTLWTMHAQVYDKTPKKEIIILIQDATKHTIYTYILVER